MTFVVGSTSMVVLILYDIYVRVRIFTKNHKPRQARRRTFFFQPWLRKYTYLPFPIQLLLVIIFTSLSYFLEFEKEFGVEVLGNIPQG